MFPGQLLSTDAIKLLMGEPKYGLAGIDTDGSGVKRASCDSCLLFDFRDKTADGKCT
jgi:hypothetical protein